MMNAFGWLKGGRWLLCVWALLLVSCLPDLSQSNTDLSECTLTPPVANIYAEDPQTTASVIFNSATTPNPPQGQQILTARYDALQALAYQVWRWSDSVDVHTSDVDGIRITVTFISPDLAEVVYLNQSLYYNYLIQDFNTRKMDVLNKVARRDEFLFLVTITATKYDTNQPITLDIPIGQMELVNSSGLSIRPHHADRNLDELIRLTRPVTGYIAYQLTAKRGNDCGSTLDKEWNNSITIGIPNLQVNDKDYGPQSWTIKYMPLLEIDMPFGPNLPALPSNYDQSHLSPLSSAPDPVLNATDFNLSYQNTYWENMGRFVWSELTLANPK